MNKIFSFCLLLFAVVSCQTAENQPVITELQGETLQMYEKGEQLFAQYCASCHNANMLNRATASALGGITARREKKWLYDYIRNPAKMVRENDPQALEIHQNNAGLMVGSPNLTDKEIDQILVYIEATYQNNKIRLRPVER